MNLTCIKIVAVFCIISSTQIKADFYFRVPSLGCPVYFTEALIEGLNELRYREAGDEFRRLVPDYGVLAFEAQAWAATNRYLGDRRPKEHLFGQSFWYWTNDPDLTSFRFSIQDFTDVKQHFRPMIWNSSSNVGSWIPYTKAEWSVTTRVGVGCLTDYNSFYNGVSQVFVVLFFDYHKNRSLTDGGYKKLGVTDHPLNLRPTLPNRPHITTVRQGTLQKTPPTSPQLDFNPGNFPTFSHTTKRPLHPFYQTTEQTLETTFRKDLISTENTTG